MLEDGTSALDRVFEAANRHVNALEDRTRRQRSGTDVCNALEVSQDCIADIDRFIVELRRERLQQASRRTTPESLHELLALHDEQFVDAAYLSILRRHPDPDGRAHFLQSVRSGRLSKAEVLGRLRYSHEGRQQDVRLAGLSVRYGVRLLTRVPILGGVLRFALAVVRLPALLGSIQRLESATFRGTLESETRLSERLQAMAQATHASLASLVADANRSFAEVDRRTEQLPLLDLHGLRASVDGMEGRMEQLVARRLLHLRTESRNALEALGRENDARIASLREQFSYVRRFEPPSRSQLDSPSVAGAATRDGDDGLYARFEARFRGERADILDRLREVLPYATPTFVLGASHAAIDLGCGRGEWLELLASEGLPAVGVDLDEDFVATCQSRGLSAINRDALDFLRGIESGTVPLVSAFHVIEHLSVRDLLTLLDECRRVLVPGGRILFETPNPENLAVGANHFWYDHTHVRPLSPDLMQFFCQDRGFVQVQIARLRKNRLPDELTYVDTGFQYNHQINSLVTLAKQHLLSSPDYAIVAEVPRPANA